MFPCQEHLPDEGPCSTSNEPLIFFFDWYSLHARLNSHYEAWRHGLTRKRSTKRLKHTGKIFVNSRLKATKIIGQRKAFYRQRIPESSCARKETVDIDILVTFRNGDRKIMQSIRITSRPPSRIRKWNQLSQFR